MPTDENRRLRCEMLCMSARYAEFNELMSDAGGQLNANV